VGGWNIKMICLAVSLYRCEMICLNVSLRLAFFQNGRKNVLKILQRTMMHNETSRRQDFQDVFSSILEESEAQRDIKTNHLAAIQRNSKTNHLDIPPTHFISLISI
jgi:hypothetical protein